jgi:outer membrane protein TolC
VGNYIEVKDSEVTLSNAKLAYINAVFDYNLAIANLKKVMGTK